MVCGDDVQLQQVLLNMLLNGTNVLLTYDENRIHIRRKAYPCALQVL
jgi:phosphoglycerate-specific signal transduction histidine kinase